MVMIVVLNPFVDAAEKKSLRGIESKLMNSNDSEVKKTEEHLPQILALSDKNTLESRKVYKDRDGGKTVRYTQFYKGLKVISDDIIVSYKADESIKNIRGFALYNIDEDLDGICPSLSKQEALNIAKKASQPKTESANANKPVVYERESATLAIWQDKKGVARLIYEVSFLQQSEQPSRPRFIIDAKTGAILDSFENLQHTQATGIGRHINAQ